MVKDRMIYRSRFTGNYFVLINGNVFRAQSDGVWQEYNSSDLETFVIEGHADELCGIDSFTCLATTSKDVEVNSLTLGSVTAPFNLFKFPKCEATTGNGGSKSWSDDELKKLITDISRQSVTEALSGDYKNIHDQIKYGRSVKERVCVKTNDVETTEPELREYFFSGTIYNKKDGSVSGRSDGVFQSKQDSHAEAHQDFISYMKSQISIGTYFHNERFELIK